MNWPPDFSAEMKRRAVLRRIFESTDDPRALAMKLYKDDPVEFISDWAITYDPRNASRKDKDGNKLPLKMPFIMFERQKLLVEWLVSCLNGERSGLIEKCRDMGATWVCSAFSVWLWLYGDGAAIGWGSRKEALVDRLGDPSCIFDKIRKIIDHLPDYMRPIGFNEKENLSFMKIINPETGGAITGEGGDNIGRGGRTTIYFKDESAHYARPELIEAALGDNTDVQIDISSVNGPGNVFYKKRHGGDVDVFIMDWRDHPAKTQAWYDKRKAKSESEGLSHIFAQEVDRDYTAAVEGVLIPGKWVKAAIDYGKQIGIKPEGDKKAGFDVADEGGDVHAFVGLHGIFVNVAEHWGAGDTHEATSKVDNLASENGIKEIRFDSVGVGAGVKASAKRLKSSNVFVPYSGSSDGKGHAVRHPDRNYTEGKKNKDMFANTKAQDWWLLRDRFRKTYENAVKGRNYTENELIIIDSTISFRDELVAELSQVTYTTNGKGQILINKKANGTKSPNLADALVMANSNCSPGRGPSLRVL